MARTTKKTRPARSSKPRRDVAAEVTAKIVESLESGVAPWTKPWNGDAGFAPALPMNARTGRRYNGINVLILWSQGYADPRWLTYRQAQDMGGNVRKGEKGTGIVFWRFVEKEEVQADGTTEKKRIGFAKFYTVFNVAQCDGLELDAIQTVAANPGTVADEVAERNGADVTRTGSRAFYRPSTDQITVPAAEAFEDVAAYSATLLHELAHWTGAESRLDRLPKLARFGDESYAAEELVAELGAAFMCATLGIQGKLQHVEYLGHWIKVLKSDKHAIFTAAREAQKAMDFLLGSEDAEEEDADAAVA